MTEAPKTLFDRLDSEHHFTLVLRANTLRVPNGPWLGRIFVIPEGNYKRWTERAIEQVRNNNCEVIVLQIPNFNRAPWFIKLKAQPEAKVVMMTEGAIRIGGKQTKKERKEQMSRFKTIAVIKKLDKDKISEAKLL
jgi:hypothetical protein